jgi:menaquinone-dependent protoporphyrinogen oxidase
MPARRILIVYASLYGQTEKIARYIAAYLATLGDAVTLVDANQLQPGPAIGDFDLVLVGASVTYGRHQKSARRFVLARREALNNVPGAFFSVSGSAASEKPEGQAAARQYVDDFLRETGWHPRLTTMFGGTMAYTKYSPIMRWFIKRISARQGGPTDTSCDHERTDWAQVKTFAESCVELVDSPVNAPPLVGVEG